ncbi:MAG: ATP-binding protein [Nitrospira sp.]|nr:ATP-binding protein [Nitrospira sp.]MDH4250768.1 ATP-binding protein [Nitrospira sp.]MDH4341901.1 ATP-binding protein [Nitrospira sp.]MDH5337071.1 ATP-binding protein [Nitrospira sp.]
MSTFNPSTSNSRSKTQKSRLLVGEETSLILEAVPEAIFFLDHDNRILLLNPVAQQLVGQTRDVIGLGFHDLIGCFMSGESEVAQCPFTRMVDTGELVVIPSHFWDREDGTQFELSLSFWPKTQQGVLVGGMVVVRDLTDTMEIQRDVQRAARLAEDAPNPIVEFDATGAMLYANTGMLNVMAQCGLLEAGIEVMFPAVLPAMLQECLTTNSALMRVEHVVADRVIAWSLFPLEELKLVRAYGLDITSDVALRRAKEAAEESTRAKDIFLATMSHELRTPMNGVLGCAQLLKDTSLTDQQRELIETMHRSADALLTLVNDILDFSKIEAGKMTLEVADVNLGSLICDVTTLMEGLASRKGLTVSVQIDPDVPEEFRGDPIRLRQILFNLVGNAIKFTERGRVTVTVSLKQGRTEGSDSVVLQWRIQDTGIGMTPEQQVRLFRAYAQADASTTRKFGGTGLGLMICHQLVQLMGGAITVESSIGQGSTFAYTTNLLPAIHRDGSTSSLGTDQRSMGEQVGLLRVLVADDNEINQVVACKYLQKLGCHVEIARTGREAVEAITRTTYDVVLMDCEMPDMDGYEATREIRLREDGTMSHLPIMALTGHASDEDAQKCHQAGMDKVITKPLTLPILRASLRELLQQANS